MKSVFLVTFFMLVSMSAFAASCPCSERYVGERLDVRHASLNFYDRSVVFSPCSLLHLEIIPDSKSTNCGSVRFLYSNSCKPIEEKGCFQAGVFFRDEVLRTMRKFKCGKSLLAPVPKSPRKRYNQRCLK